MNTLSQERTVELLSHVKTVMEETYTAFPLATQITLVFVDFPYQHCSKEQQQLMTTHGVKRREDGTPQNYLAVFARAGFKNKRFQELQNKPEGAAIRAFVSARLQPDYIDDLFQLGSYHVGGDNYHYKPWEDTLGKNMVFRGSILPRQFKKYFPEEAVAALYTEERLRKHTPIHQEQRPVAKKPKV